jgi:hypothetical protein
MADVGMVRFSAANKKAASGESRLSITDEKRPPRLQPLASAWPPALFGAEADYLANAWQEPGDGRHQAVVDRLA